jgi:steroid 5-alpha reductase family enzyme
MFLLLVKIKEKKMNKEDLKAITGLPLTILFGAAVALAGSVNSSRIADHPLFLLLVALAFVIQWLAFLPAYILQSEKFYDITGSITYISITLLAFFLSPVKDFHSLLLLILVLIWAARLGSFLFRRVHRAGKDGRFDDIKPHFFRFLTAWTLQGLWVTFTLSAALVVITSDLRKAPGIFTWLGLAIWILGFSFEVIADLQKNRFRAEPGNKGRFIQSGLWSRSRHPNYFGEITLWLGIAVIALPILRGWQWVTLISPVFVTFLLTQISGIPILEKRADAKWGGQEDYETYKKNTPVLIPKL